MSRRPNTLDQFLDIGGSCTQSDASTISNEPLNLGSAVSGQTGAAASVSVVVGDVVTITGVTGMVAASVGRCLVISGAASAGNNGTFKITTVSTATTINVENSAGVAGDANNGSISWVEREPYTLEDDINYARTNTKLIKGTTNWHDPIPTYIRPDDTLIDQDASLFNIASKTLDAHAWIESRAVESISVSASDSFITISIAGELKHADSTDTLGVPVTDGYDAGNDRAAFVEIVDAVLDGYGDGANLRVLAGPNIGNRIFGLTRVGSSTSPNSVEIRFMSTTIDNWDLSGAVTYSWEGDQPNTINVCYGYRQRLDRFDEVGIRSTLIKGALSDTSAVGGGGSSGISEATHKTLRHLIHFIDDGPGGDFASGAFKEILPSGNPFPTSYIWYESVAKLDKIVELTVTRGTAQKPITEVWEMYDTDGSTILATVTDTISYSGPFETTRLRAIVV